MNPTAIYSKSGKGVQEASGKTSHLNRGDRAVLSAIDGRATLGDVAVKVGKTFDNSFKELISKLDKEGFIREASPGVAAKGAPAPAAKAAAKSADSGGGGDLDFSSLGGGAPPKAAPPPPPQRPAAPPPRPAAPPPPPPPPKPSAAAEAQAKAQQSALQKAREEAEAKADAERQRVKLEAEAKMRAEMEAKARDEASQKIKLEAEAKAKAEADAKIKAAQEAAARVAAEAKAKADAEAKARVEAERKAREEAERARKAAEEEARRAREEAERARKAAEEEARRVREEAERAKKAAEEEARRAREEAEKARKAAEEERKREEAERAARRKREEEEAAARRKAREEEDRREEEERSAKRKRRDEEEEQSANTRRRQREEQEAQQDQEAAAAKAAAKRKLDEEVPVTAKSAASGLDSLMSDLDSFTTHDENERKEQEEAERKAKEAAAQRAREEEERRAKEEAERKEKEEARARKDEEKRRKKEEEEAFAKQREKEEQRLKEEEAKRKKEAEDRERKAKKEEVVAAQANRGPATAVGEDTDEVRKRMLGKRGGAAAAPAAVYEPVRRKKSGLGSKIVIALVVVLAAGVGVVHFMPVSTGDYERAASEALGVPVKIGSASLSLLGGGLQIKMSDIRLGDDVRIASGLASPEFGSLRSEKKKITRIELDGVKLPQEAIGQVLLAKVLGDNFAVERVVVKRLELVGPATLPSPLEADLVYGATGVLTQATVRGPDTLFARITPGTNQFEYVVTAGGFPLPVLPGLTLSDFGMKGTASQRGMQIQEWGGKIYGGAISGTANVRWSGGWTIDGVLTARNINAAVFAPALVSEGKAEGTGRFSMSGSDPAKLGSAGRLEGNFTINSGALGSFDLGRVIRTSGKEYAGRTQFTELTGQATYDRGAVSLRNVAIGAGALNAGASADISQSGALSGRIVADVKSASGGRALSATLHLGGTIKEPQVKN